MAEIRLVGVTKRFPGAAAPTLEPLDLTMPAGELVVLVGPSGCGKSTTLRIIAGLEEPTAGDVFLGGRKVTDTPPAERDIAMVFQSYALYPHMTVRENLAFALELRKTPRADIDRRVAQAARALAIEDQLAKRPRELSGGQRQRVAIGRAVVRDPKVFLFDEPLSNLDAQLRGEMRREIARIHARAGATMVYVTHDQVEAMTLADRIVVMRARVVQQVGTPLELYDAPQNLFVAGFLGSPAMNFVTGAGAGRLVGREDVVVGVRPHDVALAPRGDGVSVTGRVEARELLGSEAYVHVASDAGPFVVRAEAHAAPPPGESVSVWIDRAKLHLFDKTSERRV